MYVPGGRTIAAAPLPSAAAAAALRAAGGRRALGAARVGRALRCDGGRVLVPPRRDE